MNYVNLWNFLGCREGGSRKGRQKDYNPTMWNEHFAEKRDVVIDEKNVFRVYLSKKEKDQTPPLLVLLHGGGYSALSWAHFTVSLLIKLVYFTIFKLLTSMFTDRNYSHITLPMFSYWLTRSWWYTCWKRNRFIDWYSFDVSNLEFCSKLTLISFLWYASNSISWAQESKL